jgi:hypothetical protein
LCLNVFLMSLSCFLIIINVLGITLLFDAPIVPSHLLDIPQLLFFFNSMCMASPIILVVTHYLLVVPWTCPHDFQGLNTMFQPFKKITSNLKIIKDVLFKMSF